MVHVFGSPCLGERGQKWDESEGTPRAVGVVSHRVVFFLFPFFLSFFFIFLFLFLFLVLGFWFSVSVSPSPSPSCPHPLSRSLSSSLSSSLSLSLLLRNVWAKTTWSDKRWMHTWQGYVENMLREFEHVLTLRVRMPIDGDVLCNKRNFIYKISHYNKAQAHACMTARNRGVMTK